MTEAGSPFSHAFASEGEYRAAIDAVLAGARQALCLFDRDLSRMRLGDKERAALLEHFLSGNGKLRLVLREPGPLAASPRLQALFRRYASAVELRLVPENLAHLADCLLLADGQHGVIRFHFDHARGKRVGNDENELAPRLKRFEELWELSEPCSLGAVGL